MRFNPFFAASPVSLAAAAIVLPGGSRQRSVTRVQRLAIVAAALVAVTLVFGGSDANASGILPAPQTVFTVDAGTDVASPNCNDASHPPNSPGNCSLREAITRADAITNNKYGIPSIYFAVTPGFALSFPDSPPHITRQVYISGHSDAVDRQPLFWFGVPMAWDSSSTTRPLGQLSTMS